MLTCVLSCSELAFLQKLVTYVEKKGGIQKLLRRLYIKLKHTIALGDVYLLLTTFLRLTNHPSG